MGDRNPKGFMGSIIWYTIHTEQNTSAGDAVQLRAKHKLNGFLFIFWDYMVITSCWIPLFNLILKDSSDVGEFISAINILFQTPWYRMLI